MPFVVTGVIPGAAGQAGSAYSVLVDSTRARTVEGNLDVLALLDRHVGQEIMYPPSGPLRTLDLADETTILHALAVLTRVHQVEGDDVPEIVPPRVPGAVY